jgi:hypothetical protein
MSGKDQGLKSVFESSPSTRLRLDDMRLHGAIDYKFWLWKTPEFI